MVSKKIIIIIVVCVVAATGLGLGLYFGLEGSSDDASTNSGNDSNENPDSKETSSPQVTTSPSPSDGSSGGSTTPSGSPTPSSSSDSSSTPSPSSPPSNKTDPTKEDYVLTTLAIGDWGTTLAKPGSNVYKWKDDDEKDEKYYEHYWAQKNVAEVLAQAAVVDPKPQVIIGHGDNFYWNGIGKDDVASRFDASFEQIYNQQSLKGIKWINVVGNHDVGGSYFICGDRDGSFRRCTSIAEMLEYLDKKFTLQAEYKSPNYDRWFMPNHYYKYTVKSADEAVSIDIFNIDTNFADSHAARQICCQCYAYGGGDAVCSDVDAGHKNCAGGNVEMYNACFNHIGSWWKDSLEQFERDVQQSTATWRIINTHYSPLYHMGEARMKEWENLFKKYNAMGNNVQVYINGHTHSENHDFADYNMHYIENGAGGGIMSQSASLPDSGNPLHKGYKNIWAVQGNTYGVFRFSASKEWLKSEFVTFDDQWQFKASLQDTVTGGVKVGHCWYIPKDGSYGQACSS